MRTALLFSGQGETAVHTAVQQHFAENSPLIARALRAADCKVDSLFHNGGEMLRLTHILQPLLIALLLTKAIRAKEDGFEPDFFAGHSLGELAAWASAGAMTPEDAVEIAAVRGREMARVANMHEGDMLALTDTDTAEVQRMLTIGREHGQITVGAYNAPREVVLTGTLPALQAVTPLCQSRRLNIGGPWHSPLMEGAKAGFATALDKLCIGRHIRPVVSGNNGTCITDAREMSPQLLAQLTGPLHWTKVLATLTSLGVKHFVIAGPGRVLRYLVRRNLPQAKVALI